MNVFRLMTVLTFGLLGGGLANAQSTSAYPSQPVRLIVPFAPGGAADIVGRALSVDLSSALGQSVFVENVPGAGGAIGTRKVVSAQPDGYTLLLSSLSTLGMAAENLPYDPLNDIQHISRVAFLSNVLVVPVNSPFKSVKDLIEAAKLKPNEILYGTGGMGTSVGLASELFNAMANVKLGRVMYKGSGPALPDLVESRIHVMFDNVPSAMPYVTGGKLRAIAVTAGQRLSRYPDLPTIAESGVPGYELIAWFGVSVPKGVPEAVIERLQAAVKSAGESAEFRKRLDTVGAEAITDAPGHFSALFRKEHEKFTKALSGG